MKEKWMPIDDELMKISISNQRVKNVEYEDLKKKYLDMKY
jgi:hypothetical protein